MLGATGLLGNAVYRVMSESNEIEVFGTIRRIESRQFFISELMERLIIVEDLGDPVVLERLLDKVMPEMVINCISLGKPAPLDPMSSISVFSLFPKLLSHMCRKRGARLIQMSSDGVFSGSRGNYSEDDLPDPQDLYGVAKLLGEINESHAITIRTSIIGPELQDGSSLLEWFLSQKGKCRCFTQAIFSGFPTVVLARLIRDEILPRQSLWGIYHVASQPISKFNLLELVAKRYSKTIELLPDDKIVIDRSLCADRFQEATNYTPPEWPELIDTMYSYNFGLMRK